MKKCECGKAIKGNYKQCYECLIAKKRNSRSAGEEEVLPNQQTPISSIPAPADSIDDRILKQLCLKIAGNFYGQTDAFRSERVIALAKQLYNDVKKDGWL